MMIHTKKIEELQPLLSCPCNLRSEVKLTENGVLACTHEKCPRDSKSFLSAYGQPVLVNFEGSVFKQENFINLEDGSVLNRKRSSLTLFLRHLLWGTNKKAELNLDIFITNLMNINSHPTILVVGGGAIGSGTDDLYNNPAVKVISFDVYCSKYTDFVADAHAIPIKDESIDGVWIQAVLEHVLEPAKVVAEIHRILKSDGIVYAETPFMQQVHEKAYDFTRFTESGHRWLFKNFELIDSGIVLGPATSLIWSIRYFFSALFRSKKIGAICATFFFWLRFFDNFIPDNYSSDAASSIFIMAKKSDQSLLMDEIINFYPGVR